MSFKKSARAILVRPWWAWILLILDSIGRVQVVQQFASNLPVIGSGLAKVYPFLNGWGSLLVPILIFLILLSFARHSLGVIAREYAGGSTGRSPSLSFSARLQSTRDSGNVSKIRTSIGNDVQWIVVRGLPQAICFTKPEGEITRDLPFKFRWRHPWRVWFRRMLHGLPEPFVVVHRYEAGKGLEVEGKNLTGELVVEVDVYY
jgi:hypothetical protein